MYENYLEVFVCHVIYPRICLAICLEICPVGKIIQKVMVSRNMHQAHLLKVGLTKILGDHETLSIVRHVGLHVHFSSMKSSLDLYAFTFVCEVNLDGLRLFNQ